MIKEFILLFHRYITDRKNSWSSL